MRHLVLLKQFRAPFAQRKRAARESTNVDVGIMGDLADLVCEKVLVEAIRPSATHHIAENSIGPAMVL